MPSHTLRRGRRPELQANRKIEPSREAQPVENKDDAASIAAQLRALIPCSTDPAWLEKMAREIAIKAHQRKRWARPAGVPRWRQWFDGGRIARSDVAGFMVAQLTSTTWSCRMPVVV
jgi:hypothetical protein